MEEKDIRQTILNEIMDSVSRLMYYDRKEDEELGVGVIEEAIRNGTITVDEIVNTFREQLESNI